MMLTAYCPIVQYPVEKLNSFSASEQPIDEADLHYSIILDRGERVMDGMRRICKAVREGKVKSARRSIRGESRTGSWVLTMLARL
jgi:hypothetical protein